MKKGGGCANESKTLDRLKVAETALAMLERDELPHVKRLVFQSEIDIRSLNAGAGLAAVHDLDAASRTTGIIKSSLREEGIRFTLYHDAQQGRESAELLACALESAMRVTYAAIGLDMAPFGKATDSAKEKSL